MDILGSIFGIAVAIVTFLFAFIRGNWFELLTIFFLFGIYEELSSIRRRMK